MKRHPAFQDLSRDHFSALNRCLQVVRAVEGHPAAWPFGEAFAAFRALWTRDGLPVHFDEEEADLVPVLHAHPPTGRELAERMRSEHRALRDRLGALSADERAEAAATARLLTAHVRWEEEVVFEWMQANLPAAQLDGLLAQSQSYRSSRGRPVNPPRP